MMDDNINCYYVKADSGSGPCDKYEDWYSSWAYVTLDEATEEATRLKSVYPEAIWVVHNHNHTMVWVMPGEYK